MSVDEAVSLEKVAARVGAKPLFRWGRASVSPQNWLGIVRAGELELAIVPKGWNSLSPDIKSSVETNLVMLAARSLGLPLHVGGLTAVRPELALSDHIYRLFLNVVRTALRRRTVRTYRENREVGLTLRGSLDFPRQSLVQITTPTNFSSRYSELSLDNSFNRVLAEALRLVAGTGREDLRASALVLLGSLKMNPPRTLRRTDRSTARRMQLGGAHIASLDLAELIIDGTAFGLFIGDARVGAHLTSSSRLWEMGVTSLLVQHQPFPMVVQPRGHFAFDRIVGLGPTRVLQLVPDAMTDHERVVIVDLKWKLIDRTGPQIDRVDLYQALAYARHFGATEICLVYPSFEPPPFLDALATSLETVTGPRVQVRIILVPLTGTSGDMRAALDQAVFAAAPEAA